MTRFVTFRHSNEDGSIAIRVAENGLASSVRTAANGEVIRSVEGHLDETRASELIASAMMIFSRPNQVVGPYTVGIGHGDDVRLTTFGDDELSPKLQDFIYEMNHVIAELDQRGTPHEMPLVPRDGTSVILNKDNRSLTGILLLDGLLWFVISLLSCC